MTPRKAKADSTPPIDRLRADFFRVLGNPTRIRALELLRNGEMTVGELQVRLGIDSSGASQHLSALRRQGILTARKEGTSVHYSVRDPRVFQLLEAARQVIGSHLEEQNALLVGLGEPTREAGRPSAKTRAR